MKRRQRVKVGHVALALLAAGVSGQGGVIEFDDKDAWITAAVRPPLTVMASWLSLTLSS